MLCILCFAAEMFSFHFSAEEEWSQVWKTFGWGYAVCAHAQLLYGRLSAKVCIEYFCIMLFLFAIASSVRCFVWSYCQLEPKHMKIFSSEHLAKAIIMLFFCFFVTKTKPFFFISKNVSWWVILFKFKFSSEEKPNLFFFKAPVIQKSTHSILNHHRQQE